MRLPSLRNLIIGYSIAVIIVLLTIWITFSSLRSQEKELETISKTREVLQKIQPTFLDLTDFESQLGTAVIFHNGKLTDAYTEALKKIRNDSASMTQLAASHPENKEEYNKLAGLLHNMTVFADFLLDPAHEKKIGQPGVPWHNDSGKEIVTAFKTISDKLEAEGRKTLTTSYGHTINLTRQTFDYVKIIAAVLILILFISFLLIYRDIRDREKKQEQLRKFNEELEKKVDEKTTEIRASEKKYRAVIEQASDAIMVTDQKGNFVEVNTALCTQFGYTRDELLKLHISNLIDAEQLKSDPIRFDLLAAGHSISRERRMVHKDGTIIEVEANVKMLPDGRLMAIARDITERKKAQEQIIREKNLSESIIDSLPGIFYIRSLSTGKCLRWNKNFQAAIGGTDEEITNSQLYDFIAEEDKDRVKEAVARVLTEGYGSVEAFAQTKNGKVPYFITGMPINYENQPCIMGTGIDITERKKAEQELVRSEETRRLIMDSSLDAIICMNTEGMISVWTPQAERVFGWKEKDVLGKVLADLIIPEQYRERHRKGLERYMSTGKSILLSQLIEITALNNRGEEFPVELTIVPFEQGGQTFFCGFVRDITERKKAEEALKKSEANLKTIFETTDDGYALMDENFGIISYNQRGLDFVVNELKGKPQASNNLIDFLPPDRGAFLSGLKEKVFAGRNVGYEISYPQDDESFRWYYIRMFPVTNDGKKILGLMMAVSDITEKKLMEQTMLEQKVQEQKKIIRAVLKAEEAERNKLGQELHDNINQILASVKIYLSMAKSQDEKNVKEIIAESSGLLDQAINEIRALSKSQVTPLKKIDLEELIQSLIDKLSDSTSIKTKFIYALGSKTIDDDLKLNIYRIVQEQINNILKHAGATEISIVIEVDDQYLYASVTDNGKGFDPEKKRNGIGVSNMINRVESFNGELEIISSPGKGCKTEIRIPC